MGTPDRILGKTNHAVYFYFDNDQAGYAATNALRLREMVFGRTLKRAS
jgi:uncharacterized protein YecE (DUF72 family)